MNRETLDQFLKPLLRWWWLILAAALVAGVTCLVYVRMRPDIYASHATLVVGSAMRDPNPDTSQLQLGSYLARRYADMAERSTVHDAVKSALGMSWLPEYSVSTQPDSQMIEVVVTDSDPQRAQVVAAELVHQIVLLSPGSSVAESRTRFTQDQLSSMELDISATESEIAARREELAAANNARLIVSLKDEIVALESKLASLRDSYANLLSSTNDGAANAIGLLEAPSLPTEAESTGGLLLVLLATAMGGLLAAAGAYLLDFLDDSISTNQQVEETLHLATLGAIPELAIASKEGDAGQALVMHHDPYSLAAEAFRVLRTNVLFASVDEPLRQILVSSPAEAEGKSTVAANLAIAMAQSGQRVILVDCDLRRPTQHRLFGLRNNSGLSTALLAEEQGVASAVQVTAIPNLSVLTSGPLPPNPAEMLGSRRMAALLDSLKAACDLVVVDSPPVNAVTDAAVIAARADSVLLVLRAGQSGRRDAQYALTALNNARARVLGVVLNAQGRTAFGYSAYRAIGSYGVYGAYGASRTASRAPGNAPQGVTSQGQPLPQVAATTPDAQAHPGHGGNVLTRTRSVSAMPASTSGEGAAEKRA